jgi:hypothetical protein
MVTQLRVFFGGPLFVVVGVVFVARVSLHHQSGLGGVHGVETCCYSALCEPVNLCAFAEAIAVGVCAEHTPGSEVQGRAWEVGGIVAGETSAVSVSSLWDRMIVLRVAR